MPTNVVKAGGEMIYNIYDKSFDNVKDVSTLKKLTQEKLKENPLDVKSLAVGDVVGIYMPNSPVHKTALEEGTTKNTHVGIVTGIDKNGIPIVEHNIHGLHKTDKASDLRIAVAARPKESGVEVKQLHWDLKDSKFKLNAAHPKEMDTYMRSLSGLTDIIHTIYPNVNTDDLQQMAIGILKRETNYMTRPNKGKLQAVARFFKDETTNSSELVKMKYNALTPTERDLIGIKEPKDLNDPKKAAAGVMFLLSRNYDYMQRLSEKYPDLGITKDDVVNATVLSYNQGMSKLRTLGFDNEGVKDLQEILELRRLSNPETKIKDVTSTNYKYLGQLGSWLYDKFEDPYTPYVASFRKALRDDISLNN